MLRVLLLMARQCCGECGRPMPAPKRQAGPVDVDTMTTDQRFAHYKRIAPEMDLRFLLRFTISDALRARIESDLLKPTPKAAAMCRDSWRAERQAAERAAGVRPVGNETDRLAWVEAAEAERQAIQAEFARLDAERRAAEAPAMEATA